MHTDAHAAPLLIDTMRAAGFHDTDAAVTALTSALEIVSVYRVHKSRPDIEAALTAAHQSDWVTCWGRSYQAITGLTNTFPPEITLCPPVPVEQPHAEHGCHCGAVIAPGARFCSSCGAPA